MENQPGITDDYVPMDAKRLLERFHTALNTRDLENLLRLFHVDFESFYPDQPDRDAIGLGTVRAFWEETFSSLPDFQADLLRSAIEGETIWSEWRWHGGEDGAKEGPNRMDHTGVIIFGVEEGLLAWERMYI